MMKCDDSNDSNKRKEKIEAIFKDCIVPEDKVDDLDVLLEEFIMYQNQAHISLDDAVDLLLDRFESTALRCFRNTV